MGLLRELVDEVIPLPDQANYDFPTPEIMVTVYKLPYAVINAVFQFIDCVAIPQLTLMVLSGNIQLGIFHWIAVIIGILATTFSWFQVVKFFLSPTNNYTNPVSGRLIGETAIGALLSALFRIPIHSTVK
jgi:hypothetical protein